MKQRVKVLTLQYAQRNRGPEQSPQDEERELIKNRGRNRGLPTATPTEALLEELRKLYGEQAVPRDVFGRRTALPSEIVRALNGGRKK